MELQLNNKQLGRIFTTARKLDIEKIDDLTVDYNGIIIKYDNKQDLIDDMENINKYIIKLNNAIYY